MNDANDNKSCPCQSGLPYSDCCGAPGRTAINADIRALVGTDGSLLSGDVTPQINAGLDSLADNPDLFLVRFNLFDDRAYFVKMSPRWYKESVFLDPARIRGTYLVEIKPQWLQAVCEKVPWQPAAFIFHTAFCGSTLMSQALDSLFNTLPLREPEAAGNLLYYLHTDAAEREKKRWLECTMRLLSRRYDSRQKAVIKTNDHANRLMDHVRAWRNDVPALFMYTPLNEFLAGCLKAQNRREWIRSRYRALGTAVQGVFGDNEIPEPADNAYGEMAALYWSYNIALFYQGWRKDTANLRSLEFNRMLAAPLEAVRACGELFELNPLPDIDDNSEIDRLFGTYSKNRKIQYSPEQRHKDIQQIIANNQEHLHAATDLAKQLLKNDYPEDGLPGGLLD
jgi:hypothetical protein